MRFVLTIFDDQRSLLTTEDLVTREEYAMITRAFDRWMRDGGVAILADCRVNDVRQTILTLELSEDDEDVGVVPTGPVPQGVVADDGYDS